jgi:hypothetical protein
VAGAMMSEWDQAEHEPPHAHHHRGGSTLRGSG